MDQREFQSHRSTQRMTGQMDLGQAHGVHELFQHLGKLIESATTNLLRRPAMSREVQGIDDAILGEIVVIEQPAIQVATKAVNQNGGLPVLASL